MEPRPELLATHSLPIDAQALRAYLEAKLPDVFKSPGELLVQKFSGGQSNPTYKLTVGDKSFVLRKKPPGTLLATAPMVDREYRIISALYGSGVPVAKPIIYCDDPKVIGT